MPNQRGSCKGSHSRTKEQEETDCSGSWRRFPAASLFALRAVVIRHLLTTARIVLFSIGHPLNQARIHLRIAD